MMCGPEQDPGAWVGFIFGLCFAIGIVAAVAWVYFKGWKMPPGT